MTRFELELGSVYGGARIPLNPPYRSSEPERRHPGLEGWISLKRAGDMGNSADRRKVERTRYLRSLGIRKDRRIYSCRQVHSRRVVVVTDQDPDRLSETEADGLITNRRDAVLTVTVADCLPIFLVDPEHGAFSLLHSGWRGTGIAVQALERMAASYGSRPSSIEAIIGPGIGSCCYRVEKDRSREFRRRFGPNSVREHGGHLFLDLAGANVGLLTRRGVEKIRVCRNCTACTPQLFSFRREGAEFGHMLACIGELDHD